MKRFIAIVLILCALLSFSVAEDIDLSGLSFDQLVALKNRINLALWNSQEWQEVTVPQGLWVVGKDIPAGSWTVRCAADYTAVVAYGDTLKSNGRELKMTEYADYKSIESPNYRHYQKGISVEAFSFTVKDGDYIEISNCDVVFSPYAGKPDLGFK